MEENMNIENQMLKSNDSNQYLQNPNLMSDDYVNKQYQDYGFRFGVGGAVGTEFEVYKRGVDRLPMSHE